MKNIFPPANKRDYQNNKKSRDNSRLLLFNALITERLRL